MSSSCRVTCQHADVSPQACGGKSVRFGHRRRQIGTQGRPTKASLVREKLFEWFCSIRHSVKTRLPARAVLGQARILTEKYVHQCAVAGKIGDVPSLTRHWLRDWCLSYNVCLRQPNRRCEIPKLVLQERLRTMWCNIARVRQMARRLLGYDLAVDNVDQSPFHMNEAGSKKAGTLSIRGCGTVPLSEVHSATRERWSANTLVRSDLMPKRPIAFPGNHVPSRGQPVAAEIAAAYPAVGSMAERGDKSVRILSGT